MTLYVPLGPVPGSSAPPVAECDVPLIATFTESAVYNLVGAGSNRLTHKPVGWRMTVPVTRGGQHLTAEFEIKKICRRRLNHAGKRASRSGRDDRARTRGECASQRCHHSEKPKSRRYNLSSRGAICILAREALIV